MFHYQILGRIVDANFPKYRFSVRIRLDFTDLPLQFSGRYFAPIVTRKDCLGGTQENTKNEKDNNMLSDRKKHKLIYLSGECETKLLTNYLLIDKLHFYYKTCLFD
jgi:hypothetical protein